MITKKPNIYRFVVDPIFGSLISGGSSLLGSAFGAISTANSNKTNLKIARETNKANAALAAQANEWNLAQWNRENEYNSPVAQMERLRAAGLNPNLVYGNGATTLAAKSPSAEVAQMQPAHMQPYTNWDLGGGAAVDSFMRAELLEQQIKDSISRRDNLTYQNDLLKAQALKTLTDRKQGELDWEINNATKDAKIRLADSLARGAEEDVNLKQITQIEKQNNIQLLQERIGLTHQEAINAQKQWDVMCADIALKYSQASVNAVTAKQGEIDYKFNNETFDTRKRQVRAILNKTISEIKGQNKKNELTVKQRDALIQDMEQQLRMNGFQVDYGTSREIRAWVYGWIPGAQPSANNSAYYTTTSSRD